MRHQSVAVTKVQGELRITPELTWDQIKKSEYIPWELVLLQGRSSYASGSLRFKIKDRLLEDGTFVKYADAVLVGEKWSLTLSGLVWAIDELRKRYSEHEFDGVFHVESDHSGRYRVIVKNGKAMVLKSVQAWRPDGQEPTKYVKSRWDHDQVQWVKDDVWDRLSRANELIRLLNDGRTPQEIMKSHKDHGGDHECNYECLTHQVVEHLLTENQIDNDDGWVS